MKKGSHHTKETRRKMQYRYDNNLRTTLFRNSVFQSKMSRRHWNKPGARERMSKLMKNRVISEKVRKQISLTETGKVVSEKTKMKIAKIVSSLHKRGIYKHMYSNKTRNSKISIAATIAHKNNNNFGMKNKNHSKKTRKQMSTSAIKRIIKNNKKPFDTQKMSNPEKNFAMILNSINLRYIFNYRIAHKFYDFRIRNSKLLIEVDSWYCHHTKTQKINDAFKNKLAEENGYNLLRFADEQLNKPEEIKDRLLEALK